MGENTSHYRTISSLSTGDYREKGSKFLAYASAVYSADEIRAFLASVASEHPKSRHLCYAWRLGTDGLQFRANDDGEPSGSAGRPILGQIDSFEVTNVCIGVIRYFGGTKLGVSGLINAYRTAAADALRTAAIIEREIMAFYDLNPGYEAVSALEGYFKQNGIAVLERNFEESPNFKISCSRAFREQLELQLSKDEVPYQFLYEA